MTTRHSAFFINGGAGRVLCSIPALELFALENPTDDFIIICEGGMEFYKGHPLLHSKSYDFSHKDLFIDKLQFRNCVSPEPYRVWEYYNQQASLAQAFDIIINNKGIRSLSKPTLILSGDEFYNGLELVKEVKEKTKRKKVIVFQPFGRGTHIVSSIRRDSSGRSLSTADAITIVKHLQKDYGIIVMAEGAIEFPESDNLIATPQNISLRQWAGIIAEADYFVGIDSVGQHMANALSKRSSVLISSTFPINVSYPADPNFNILDVGQDRRIYDPIRLCIDEVSMRKNEGLMQLNDKAVNFIVNAIKDHIELSPKLKQK
jgi:hypothetical protein